MSTKTSKSRAIEITPLVALQARLALGITRKQLARYFRVDPANIHRWETEAVNIPRSYHPVYRKMIELTPHLLARRATPNWDL